MPIPGTVPVSSVIAPTDALDTYPTHDDEYGFGGYRAVANEAAKDLIPAQRRKSGMLVYVRETGKFYLLADDLTTFVESFKIPVTPPVTPPPTSTSTFRVITTNLAAILNQQTLDGYTTNYQATGWSIKALELYYNVVTPAAPKSKTFLKRYVVGTDFNIGDEIDYASIAKPAPVWHYWVAIIVQDSNPSVEFELPLVPTFTQVSTLPLPAPAIVPLTYDIGIISAFDGDNGAQYAKALNGSSVLYLRAGQGIYTGIGYSTAKVTLAAAPIVPAPPILEYPVVQEVYFKRRVEYAPKGPRDTRIGSHMFLRLQTPLEPGRTVTITTPTDQNILLPSESWATVVDDNRFSDAIHVNQYGYQVGHRKVGMVGLFLGAISKSTTNSPIAGELSVGDFGEFHIVRASDHVVVFTGVLQWRKDQFWGKSAAFNQETKMADFSAFDTPGYYKLKIPGLGCSFPFYINDKVFLGQLRFMLKGVYQGRCGQALGIPYTRQHHDACHTLPVIIPMPEADYDPTWAMISQEAQNPTNLQTADVPFTADLLRIPYVDLEQKFINGGHHDAGDFGRYTFSVAATVHFLVLAADLWGADFDNLGIPESGNGKSDLLDEAKIDADFLLRMQDSDGHFYSCLRPLTRPYDDDQNLRGLATGDQMVAYPKSSVATATAVAALAQIGGSPVFRAQFGDEAADTYLAAAINGWNALMLLFEQYGYQGAFQKIWHYGCTYGFQDDDMAWAAIELYLATGDEQYHNWVLTNSTVVTGSPWDPTNKAFWKWNWWPNIESSGNAAHSYCLAEKTGRIAQNPTIALNSILESRCRTANLYSADYRLANVEGSAYGEGLAKDFKTNVDIQWFVAGWHNFDLCIGYELQTDAALRQRYLNAYIEVLSHTFGCSALNICFLSNCGLRTYRDVVNQMFQVDKAYRILPPTGWSTGELNKFPSYSGLKATYKAEVSKLLFPNLGTSADKNDTPLRERFVDQFDIGRETTVWEGAVAVAGAVFLASRAPGSTSQPFVPVAGVISGIPDEVVKGSAVAATLTCPGIPNSELDEARIHWEHASMPEPFQGGPTTNFVNGRTLVFEAKVGGPTWLEGEAHLKDGRIIVARRNYVSRVIADKQITDFINPSNPEITAWWKMDTSLRDTINNSSELIPDPSSAMYRDNQSFIFPGNPSGGCLRSFWDFGNTVQTLVPGTLVYDVGNPNIGFSFEFMMFVEYWNSLQITGNRYPLQFGNTFSKKLQIWDKQYREGRSIHGNSGQQLCTGTEFDNAFPLKEWHHVKFVTTTSGQFLFINGAQVGAGITGNQLSPWISNLGNLTLRIGEFAGWIDDIVITLIR